MKTILVFAIFLCAAWANAFAGDEMVEETIHLDASTTLLVKGREAVPPPFGKPLQPWTGRVDSLIMTLSPVEGESPYLEFVVVRNGKESPLGKMTYPAGNYGMSPLLICDTRLDGNKVFIVYEFLARELRALHAEADSSGVFHVVCETPLLDEPGTGKFRFSDSGALEVEVKYFGPMGNDGKMPPEKTGLFELNSAGEFVKK